MSVVRLTVCATHGPGDKHIAIIALADDGAVYQVTLFRPRVHPRCLEHISLPEYDIG